MAYSIVVSYFVAGPTPGHLPALRCLVEAGARFDEILWDQDRRHGCTILYIAAQQGRLAVVRYLLEAGADPDQPNESGMTPFGIAVLHGRFAIVRSLMATGAGRGDVSSLRRARRRCSRAMACWLARSRGWRPRGLLLACDSRRGRAHVKALLQAGADPFAAGPSGHTPLEICKLADESQGCLPHDDETTAAVREALRPWHPLRHGLFPRTFWPLVRTMLLVQQRLPGCGVYSWPLRVLPFLPRFGAPRAAAPPPAATSGVVWAA